jgi:uncharacterized protein YhaN
MLVRLAIGTLLAERGGNVPIILDDALVYCDDDRINLMFDALSRAGKYQQIIVLTCFQLPTIPDAFEGYFWR